MELLLLITICLLTGQTLGDDPVKMIFKAGDQDVLLSCSFRGDLRDKKVVWIKDGKEIYVFGNGKVDPSLVDEQFRDRISHFQDELQSGNASIKIMNSKISDIGIYSCLFYDGIAPGGLWKIELTVGSIRVIEGKDAILPCHHGRDLTHERFDWITNKTDVLLYDNTKATCLTEQFKGRVSHFDQELQSGNASIKIKEAKLSDRGNYTCIRINQKDEKVSELHIELVVDQCKTPTIETTGVKGGEQVHCKALGVSPESTMELKNSAGVTVDAPVERTKNGNYDDIHLRANLTKKDDYYCVLTQGDICQQVNTNKTHVHSDQCKTPTIETTGVKGGEQVQCEALGVSLESTMELKNSAGVTVDATVERTKNGKDYDIHLRVNLTKKDDYYCVLTQGDICQQVNTKKAHVHSGAGYFLVPSSLLVFSLLLSLGF